MPELPEVETTAQGIKPYVEKQFIEKVTIRAPRLRWPIPQSLPKYLTKQKIDQIKRRGKYLLFYTQNGTMLIHLGMSGTLRLLTQNLPPEKHDHIDIHFANQTLLRFRDPRRFGAVLWTNDEPLKHPLLNKLGPEPLTKEFSSRYLSEQCKNSVRSIKTVIMDSHVVVGVGNIYATEVLFDTSIHPLTPAGELTLEQCKQLCKSIKRTLKKAIKQGGTTLKDFVDSKGKPGYFSQKLKVYGREGLPCKRCGTPLQKVQISQRSTVFCSQCQTFS